MTNCAMNSQKSFRRVCLPYSSRRLQAGLTELKDLLWREINSEENKNNFTITHRKLDMRHRVQEEDDFIFEQDEPEDDDFSNMTDEDWNEEFWDEESSVNPD